MGMTTVLIPNFICCMTDEFSGCPFGHVIGCIVTDKEGVFSFMPGADDGGGIVGDGGVSRWMGGMGKGLPQVVVYEAVGLMMPIKLCIPSISNGMSRRRG